MPTLGQRARQHYRALRRLETNLSRIAEAHANGSPKAWSTVDQRYIPLGDETIEQVERDAIRKVARLLQIPQAALFINWDPRGCQIKVKAQFREDLPTDWGGYGCPAMKRDVEAEEAIESFNALMVEFQEWYKVNHIVAEEFADQIHAVRMFIVNRRRDS